jgi:hypothetical protein
MHLQYAPSRRSLVGSAPLDAVTREKRQALLNVICRY